jgi:hypothetical protein
VDDARELPTNSSFSWKQLVTRKLRLLEAQMDTVRGSLNITEPHFQEESLKETNFDESIHTREGLGLQSSTAGIPISTPNGPATIAPRIWEMRLDPNSGPAAIPATCVEEVTDYERMLTTATKKWDCVTQGLLTLAQANTLFDIYAHRLDHYLYRILGESPSLEQTRLNSPLLTAAICTVGALHSQELGFLFDRCQKAFLTQCAALLFTKSSNIDDVRGLCIGAFWLHEVSSQLVGLGMESIRLYITTY